jgi:hypothetical protein
MQVALQIATGRLPTRSATHANNRIPAVWAKPASKSPMRATLRGTPS